MRKGDHPFREGDVLVMSLLVETRAAAEPPAKA
jgi:hypothetical protein